MFNSVYVRLLDMISFGTYILTEVKSLCFSVLPFIMFLKAEDGYLCSNRE